MRNHGVPREDRTLAPWWSSRGSGIHTGNDRNQIGANHNQSISVKMRTAQPNGCLCERESLSPSWAQQLRSSRSAGGWTGGAGVCAVRETQSSLMRLNRTSPSWDPGPRRPTKQASRRSEHRGAGALGHGGTGTRGGTAVPCCAVRCCGVGERARLLCLSKRASGRAAPG